MIPAKYCGNCGAVTDPTARFCGNCGARLNAPVAPTPSGTASGAPGSHAMRPTVPPARPPHAPGPPVTGAVAVTPTTVAPVGGLQGTVVGRGRYAIDRMLGRGGMSAVYMARDLHVAGRLVAVKEMVDQFADAQERLEAERDFAREADMLATLHHAAIPTIIDRFSENNRHLLVMEYISGENLEHKLEAHGPFDEETVRAWALELCSVLSYLHGRQPPVVFRDLKPGNIILQPDGRVRLIDFGIARLFKPQQKADTTALGTSGYASPEHYTGQTDARSDIYSLGATMHHLLTGRDPSKFPPFQFPPVRDLNPAVSSDMASVVEKAVRTSHEKRFATVDDMRKALEPKRKKKNAATTAPTRTSITPPSPRPATAAANGHAPAAPALAQGGQTPPPVVPPPFAFPSIPTAQQRSNPSNIPAPAPPPAPTPVPAAAQPAPAATAVPSPAPARQVLVVEAFNGGRRPDYAAVAAAIAAPTAGDATAIRAVLQRGLPATFPVAPGANPADGLRQLAQLGVVARVVTPRAVPVLLDQNLRRQLDTTHQLLVRDVVVGPAQVCRCRRCGYTWKTNKRPGDAVPLRCPDCRSLEWGRWRIFECAWCGHEWDTGDIHTRRADQLFPTCPCCGLPNWQTGRPAARTGWLDRIIATLAGTA